MKRHNVELLALVQERYPDWEDVNHPAFAEDELAYKHAAASQATALLNSTEYQALLNSQQYDELLNRLETVSKATNLLWRRMPRRGDTAILYASGLNKAEFTLAIRDLLFGNAPAPTRLEQYARYAAANHLPLSWPFPTYLLFLLHPKSELFIKPEPIQWWLKFLGAADVWTKTPGAAAYTAIRYHAHQLKQSLNLPDMIAVQSLIWVASQQAKQRTGRLSAKGQIELDVPLPNEEVPYSVPISGRVLRETNLDELMQIENNLILAEPFDKIFSDWEEANWAFDLLYYTATLLGMDGPNDIRFSFTLPKFEFSGRSPRLHFGIGNWLILGFRGPDSPNNRLRLALLKGLVELDNIAVVEHNFKRHMEDLEVLGYGFTIEAVRPFPEDLRVAYEKTLTYIRQGFTTYTRSPRLKRNISAIAEAVFDRDKRIALLSQGLSSSEFLDDPQETIHGIAAAPPPPPSTLHSPLPIINRTPSMIGTQPIRRRKMELGEVAAATGLSLDILQRWLNAIERKGQAVVYGPPGTGKTFVARHLADYLAQDNGFVTILQFHPAYTYEDFIEGIRPQETKDGRLELKMVPGRFYSFCELARRSPDATCVLILDEINRANLSRVFGELMYLLEYRNERIFLAGHGMFGIPTNVRIIGTMNTADRSIALVDHALRRRFAFLELAPNYDLLRYYHQQENPALNLDGLIRVLERLNSQIDKHYQVGVTFFMRPRLATELRDIWEMEILPYLEEYFFDQLDRIAPFRWERIAKEVSSF